MPTDLFNLIWAIVKLNAYKFPDSIFSINVCELYFVEKKGCQAIWQPFCIRYVTETIRSYATVPRR